MQIVQSVAIKLDGEILRLFQSEKNGVLYLFVFNGERMKDLKGVVTNDFIKGIKIK